MCVIIKVEGMDISRERERSWFQILLKGPMKIGKLGIALLIIEINGDSSKNYFGEVLKIQFNLEWAEQ